MKLISGRIGRALVTAGALVGKGEATHLATIEQIDPIRVEFTQSYSALLRLQQAVKAGKQKKADSVQVELLFEDGSLYAAKRRVQFADLAVDPSSGATWVSPPISTSLPPMAPIRVRVPRPRIWRASARPPKTPCICWSAAIRGPSRRSRLWGRCPKSPSDCRPRCC